MSLVSFNFLCFALVTAIIYYLVPQKLKNSVLLIASMAFCCFAGIYTLLFVLISAVTTFVGGMLCDVKKGTPGKRNAIATVTIVFNLLLLCLIKYYGVMGLIADRLNTILHATDGSWLVFAVPLGMSFYTLQMIGYVLDCLWGKMEPEKNFFKYLLFASYFPYLTSGPMNRYSTLRLEFDKEKKFEFDNIRDGAIRIAWGFFKKLVIAERAGAWVSAVYGNHEVYRGLYVPLGVIAFAVELYADFSGCMDVVIGLSKALGITLPENFNSPYFARTIREYWKRWHSTLGEWLQDYLFYPLLKLPLFIKIGDIAKEKYSKKYGKKEGKKRGKQIPVYLAMIILWFAVGYWHGGVWKYIIGSGLLHCSYIILGMLFEPLFEKVRGPLKADKLPFKIFQVVRTFVLVLLGFVFFRATNVPDAIALLDAMITRGPKFNMAGILTMGLTTENIIVMVVAILILGAVDLYKFREKETDEPRSVLALIGKSPAIVSWLVFVLLVAAVLVFGMYGLGYEASSFIYASI